MCFLVGDGVFCSGLSPRLSLYRFLSLSSSPSMCPLWRKRDDVLTHDHATRVLPVVPGYSCALLMERKMGIRSCISPCGPCPGPSFPSSTLKSSSALDLVCTGGSRANTRHVHPCCRLSQAPFLLTQVSYSFSLSHSRNLSAAPVAKLIVKNSRNVWPSFLRCGSLPSWGCTSPSTSRWRQNWPLLLGRRKRHVAARGQDGSTAVS